MPRAERPQRQLPRGLMITAGLLMAARLVVPEPVDRVGWVPMDEAASRASSSGRRVLYEFTADWCGPCRQMEREVFADADVARSIDARYVPVRVIDRQLEDGWNAPAVAALQERFKIGSFPTLVVAEADGRAIATLKGGRSRRAVVEFLRKYATR